MGEAMDSSELAILQVALIGAALGALGGLMLGMNLAQYLSGL